jgi:predicted nucleic acid-binding protein
VDDALLDANIILRYLTNEPRELAERVVHLFEAADGRRIDLLVAPLIVGEVVFVLESVYQWKRHEIADRLLNLINASVIEFMEQPTVAQALAWYRDKSGLHFADAYLASLAMTRADFVISLDRGLKRVAGLTVVDRPEDL